MDELNKLRELTETLTSNGYLKDQTAAWKYAFDSVKEFVCIVNPSCRIKFVNKSFLTLLNAKQEDIVNNKLSDLYNHQFMPGQADLTEEAFAETYTFKSFYVESLGKWFDMTRSTVNDDQGITIGYMFVIEDITEVRDARIKLQKSEVMFRELFNNVSSGIVVLEAVKEGKDFTIIDFNKAAEIIEGVNKLDVLDKEVTNVFPGVVSLGLLDVFKRVYATGKSEELSLGFYEDSLISGWRENFVYKLPSGEIVSVYRDVTEAKLKELELANQQALLEGVLDAIPDIIGIQDEHGQVITYNKAGLDAFGETKSTIATRKCYELLGRTTPCRNCQTTKCKVDRAPARLERYIKELNGWYDCRSYPVFNEDKQLIKVIEHLRRISDSKIDRARNKEELAYVNFP